MILAEINELFAYNIWANNRTLESVAQLSEEHYFADAKSSHGGIHGTLVHLFGAHKVWLERWQGKSDAKLIHQHEIASLDEIKKLWAELIAGTQQYFENFTEEKLTATYTITTTKGEVFIHTYTQMFQHLINHSSYHRGQIAGMVRQLGYKPLGTDLIVYHRQK
ncbi:MAG: DinB family protein [Bacteroidota bacterium]